MGNAVQKGESPSTTPNISIENVKKTSDPQPDELEETNSSFTLIYIFLVLSLF